MAAAVVGMAGAEIAGKPFPQQSTPTGIIACSTVSWRELSAATYPQTRHSKLLRIWHRSDQEADRRELYFRVRNQHHGQTRATDTGETPAGAGKEREAQG